MKIDLGELRARASDATQGNWSAVRPPNDKDGWATGLVVAMVAPRQGVYSDAEGGVAPEANRLHIAANGPLVTLALITRIEELEAAFSASLDEWNRRDEYDVSMAHRNLMRELIAKGTVLP